ncbi:hypothetical protein Vretimale_1827 [Volvox reticuliferus]|uniref:Uncharacterized protein n=1 Tax=Volvox reticuliferus TaxID=1737510 RepID=A0A8J4FTH1_9CHLO|nr:hypothetical protein Vretifemale_17341 [Volvox reticuliferus]GIL95905.1 hypothetical protein Vretimale_1827 [Volvox reticuliferus]
MYKLLAAHEEREPEAVLKKQSKRAQKRLLRQQAHTEEAERELEAHLARPNHVKGGCKSVDGSQPSASCTLDSSEVDPQAAQQMFEEIFLPANMDPGVLEDEESSRDLSSHLQKTFLNPARPDSDADGATDGSAFGRKRASLSSNHSAEIHVCAVELPPGPGPGPGHGWGPRQGHRAVGFSNGGWLVRQASTQGSAPPHMRGLESTLVDFHRLASGVGQPRCGKGPAHGVLLRLGSGVSSRAGSAGGSSSAEPDAAPSGRRLQAQPAPQPQPRWQSGGMEEDFPELRPAVAPVAQLGATGITLDRSGRSAAAWDTVDLSTKQRPHGGHNHRRGGSGVARNGCHHNGVKVLHAPRPVIHLKHGHEHSQVSHGGLRSSCKGMSGSPNYGSEAGDDMATDINLTLVCELIQGGLFPRDDPLAEEGGDIEALEPDAVAAIKRLVKSRYSEEGVPARGVSPEDMITMMARAHKRQFKIAGGAAASGTEASSDGGDGGSGITPTGGAGNGDDGGGSTSSDDALHLYQGRDESKSWRRTVDWMKENDWVLVKDGTDGKHYKYRRLLPNGQIQTQTVCCSPSDALRGIRNLQADLARKDAQANAVIKDWRRKERERRRRGSEAAAAAAAAAL